jgi:hypothetical protein
VLRGIFGPKRDEVAGAWLKLHSEELRNLHFFPNSLGYGIKGRELGVACSILGGNEKFLNNFVWEA